MNLIDRIRRVGYITAGVVLAGTIIISANSKAETDYQQIAPMETEKVEVRMLPAGKQDNLERKVGDYAPQIENTQNDSEVREKYSTFSYRNELEDIMKHAKRVGVEPELLMAIRDAEDGADNIAYGILPSNKKAKARYDNDKGYELDGKFVLYKDEKEKQLCNAAWTIRKNIDRFNKDSEGFKDFISYFASKYAPKNAKNDPKGLNENWEPNVRALYKKFKEN